MRLKLISKIIGIFSLFTLIKCNNPLEYSTVAVVNSGQTTLRFKTESNLTITKCSGGSLEDTTSIRLCLEDSFSDKIMINMYENFSLKKDNRSSFSLTDKEKHARYSFYDKQEIAIKTNIGEIIIEEKHLKQSLILSDFPFINDINESRLIDMKRNKEYSCKCLTNSYCLTIGLVTKDSINETKNKFVGNIFKDIINTIDIR